MPSGIELQVLVAQASGKLAFEDIFMFSHQSADLSKFVQIQTLSGSSITVSPDHYLQVLPVGYEVSHIIAAAQVRAGDQLQTADLGNSRQPELVPELQWSPVTATTSVWQQGLYNPHTASGTILVDSVLACTFPNTLPPSIAAHTAATMPARILYHLMPCKAAAKYLNTLLLRSYFSTIAAPRHILSILLTTVKS